MPNLHYSVRVQTKLRTDCKLPVLYYVLYKYVFPHTDHHPDELGSIVDSAKMATYAYSADVERGLMRRDVGAVRC